MYRKNIKRKFLLGCACFLFLNQGCTQFRTDPNEAVFLYRELFEKNQKHDVDLLRKVILLQEKHKDVMVRFNIAEALGELNDDNLLRILWRMAREDPEQIVRLGAVQGLINSQNKIVLKYLCKLLEDSDVDIRRKAARGCGELGDESVLDDLNQAFLNEGVQLNRMTLAAAISRIDGDKNEYFVLDVLSKNSDMKEKIHLLDLFITFDLTKLNSEELNVILGQATNSELRILAASIRIRNGIFSELSYLEGVLKNEKNPNTRMQAAKSVSELGEQKLVYPYLLELLNEKDPEIREMVIEELVEYTEFPLMPILTASLLEDHDSVVREIAAWVMGERKNVDALPVLEKALYDDNADVRTGAMVAIYKILNKK